MFGGGDESELESAISHIKIVGIKSANEKCSLCPEGFYSEMGSS